jgi:molybdate transport system permease protein
MMHLLQNEFWSPLILSLKTAGLSVGFVIIIGIVLGRLLSRKQFNGKLILETILLLPIVLPPTVIGFLLIFIFGNNSFFGVFIQRLFSTPLMFTPAAAVIASTIVAFPLMYQTVKLGFQTVDQEIEDASRVDGANEWKVFIYITLPLSLKSIVTGTILSFTRALGEFGATFMFAGNILGRTQTAPIAIYVAMESGNMKLAWSLVITMVIISFVFLLVSNLNKK